MEVFISRMNHLKKFNESICDIDIENIEEFFYQMQDDGYTISINNKFISWFPVNNKGELTYRRLCIYGRGFIEIDESEYDENVSYQGGDHKSVVVSVIGPCDDDRMKSEARVMSKRLPNNMHIYGVISENRFENRVSYEFAFIENKKR
jgi:hypothetical protein